MRTHAAATGQGVPARTLGGYRAATGGGYEAVRNIGLLLVAPFIGLAYFVATPLVGFGACGKCALQAAALRR